MRARLAALLCCAAFALPAQAFFTDSDARKQLADLRAELTRQIESLQQRNETLGKNQLGFANQIETLRADVARLTGQIEVLTNSLEAAHKRQQDFYVDLDNRLRKLETAAANAAAATAAPAQEAAPPKADPQAEMRAYETALGLFRVAKFKEAQAAFEGFIATHPRSSLLPNATYWLGASLHQQKQFGKAAETYGKVAATWPNDPKAPDALLARANAQIEARDEKAAIQTLQTLIEKYPTSPAVETARTRLKSLQPLPARKR